MQIQNIRTRFPLEFLLRVSFFLAGVVLIGTLGLHGDVLSRPLSTNGERNESLLYSKFAAGETQLLFRWEPGEGHPDHYRVEVTETHYADPAQTQTFYRYVGKPEVSLYGKDGYTYVLRVQALSPSGDRSAFSEPSETYLLEPDGTVRMIGNAKTRPDVLFTLSQNTPNPFNRETVIEYTVPTLLTDSSIPQTRLEIYSILGQTVRTWVQETPSPGIHRVVWDGTNQEGDEVASGTYIYRFECGPFTAAKTMSYVK